MAVQTQHLPPQLHMISVITQIKWQICYKMKNIKPYLRITKKKILLKTNDQISIQQNIPIHTEVKIMLYHKQTVIIRTAPRTDKKMPTVGRVRMYITTTTSMRPRASRLLKVAVQAEMTRRRELSCAWAMIWPRSTLKCLMVTELGRLNWSRKILSGRTRGTRKMMTTVALSSKSYSAATQLKLVIRRGSTKGSPNRLR